MRGNQPNDAIETIFVVAIIFIALYLFITNLTPSPTNYWRH